MAVDERLAAILNSNQQNINTQRINQIRQQQAPYGSNSSLLQNTPYDNYMGGMYSSQNYSQNQFLKGRPVSSKAEANASQIDLDGSIWIFTDFGHNRIYTKQINNDGTPSFKTYVFQEEASEDDYVTKGDLAKTVEYIMALLPVSQQQGQNAADENKTQKKSSMF